MKHQHGKRLTNCPGHTTSNRPSSIKAKKTSNTPPLYFSNSVPYLRRPPLTHMLFLGPLDLLLAAPRSSKSSKLSSESSKIRPRLLPLELGLLDFDAFRPAMKHSMKSSSLLESSENSEAGRCFFLVLLARFGATSITSGRR